MKDLHRLQKENLCSFFRGKGIPGAGKLLQKALFQLLPALAMGGSIKALLILEIVINHPLVHARPFADFAQAHPMKAGSRETSNRLIEDIALSFFGVPLL